MTGLVSENGQQLSSNGIKMIASKQDTEHDDFLKNHLFSNIDDLFETLEVLYIVFKVVTLMHIFSTFKSVRNKQSILF